MVIFHSFVSLPEDKSPGSFSEKNILKSCQLIWEHVALALVQPLASQLVVMATLWIHPRFSPFS
jgi:hypothetical protein